MDMLVPAREAARILGTSTRTLMRRRARGEGPNWVRQGGRIFYATADLTAYIEALRAGVAA